MKAYTDIDQSKKLAEILPLESSDMMYHSVENEYGCGAFVATSKLLTNGLRNDDFYIDDIPCWSLAALLGVLPEYNLQETDWGNKTEYKIVVTVNEDNYASKNYDNEVDACYGLILKLHEQKML